MRKTILVLASIIFLTISFAGYAQMKVSAGSLDSLYMESKYVDGRMIYVWKPSNFDPYTKYAVLYMNDGQSLFDGAKMWNHSEWRVDETMDSLVITGKIIPTIVVGVPCNSKRAQEYIGQKPYERLSKKVKKSVESMIPGKTLSDEYLKFLVNEVKPYIDGNYPVLSDASHTFIAGSSMGGLISMYAECEYPQVFSGAACLSTHWVGGWSYETHFGTAFPDYMDKALPSPADHKFYFDHGTAGPDSNYVLFQERVDKVMAKHKYNSDKCMSLVFEGADHSEYSWSKRLAIPVKFLLANPDSAKADLHVSKGSLESMYMPSKYLGARMVYVWKPANFDPSQKYAVLYMHDGQMLFDATNSWNKQEWRVDEVVDSLIACKSIIPTIVVGVANNPYLRGQEYVPEKALQNLSAPIKDSLMKLGKTQMLSDEYLQYLVKEVKPYIDSHYPVYTDAAHTFVAGSSMGGLISMYAICEYPEIFGGAMCMSTHWTMMDSQEFPDGYINYLASHLPDPSTHKIYFDHGDRTTDAKYGPHQKCADTVMIAGGYFSKNWKTLVFPGDDHSERSWSKRLNIPLLFMLRTSEPDEAVLEAKCLEYMKAHYQTPTEYVASKCDKYDIVILGEDHRIHENLEFAQNLLPVLYKHGVYNFGMEFGAQEDQARLDSLVNAPEYDEQLARDIMFNYNTGWAFKEYMDMYRAAWKLNRSLPEGSHKFRIINLSYKFDWKGVTKCEATPELFDKIFFRGNCEEFRAQVVKNEIIDKGEKIAILTGGTHAATRYYSPRYNFLEPDFVQYSHDGFGHRMLKMYPHQVFTISLHGMVPNYPGRKPYYASPANGRIEALVAANGNRPIGFDTATTPMGELRDSSYLSMGYPDVMLSQVCDGYVVLKPFKQLRGCEVDSLFFVHRKWKDIVDNYPDKNTNDVPASVDAYMKQIINYSNISNFYNK